MLKIHNQSTFRLINAKKRTQEFHHIFFTLSQSYLCGLDSRKRDGILRYGLLEVLLVNAKQMRAINHKERGIDKQTDVLSFPLEIMEFDWQVLESCAPKNFNIALMMSSNSFLSTRFCIFLGLTTNVIMASNARRSKSG